MLDALSLSMIIDYCCPNCDCLRHTKGERLYEIEANQQQTHIICPCGYEGDICMDLSVYGIDDVPPELDAAIQEWLKENINKDLE
jgi:hypothetical protein